MSKLRTVLLCCGALALGVATVGSARSNLVPSRAASDPAGHYCEPDGDEPAPPPVDQERVDQPDIGAEQQAAGGSESVALATPTVFGDARDIASVARAGRIYRDSVGTLTFSVAGRAVARPLRFRLHYGQRVTRTVRLNARGKKLLRARRKLRVPITFHFPGGESTRDGVLTFTLARQAGGHPGTATRGEPG